MSKSLGTVVDPLEAAERLGPDPLRLYLTKGISYGQDGDFSWERFEERYNVDLANNLGNLVSRVTSMAHRYRDGTLSRPTEPATQLADRAMSIVGAYRQAMDSLAIHQGASLAFDLVDASNEFIAEVQPWVVAKDPARSEQLNRQLYDLSEAIRIAALLLLPVMPRSCDEILRRIGETRESSTLRLDSDGVWITTGDRVISKGPPLWPRIETKADTMSEDINNEQGKRPEAKALASMATSDATTSSDEGVQSPTNIPASSKPVGDVAPKISIDEFFRVDLRVGRVVAAEAVPKSRKLMKIQLETGNGELQILAGILGSYEPEALIDRLVIYVANLKPAKLAGLESNGMILAASDPENGKPVLLTVDDLKTISPGSRVS